MALKLGVSKWRGRHLLELHRETYPRYWQWSDAVEARAVLTGKLTSPFGWQVHAGEGANARSLRNFPLQANGAEMLRLAVILGREEGVDICATIHDAILIQASLEELEVQTTVMQSCMEEASRSVLDGYELRSEAEYTRYPEAFGGRQGPMWDLIQNVIDGRHEH